MKIPLQEALDLIEASDVVKLLDGSSFILPHITTEGTNGDPFELHLFREVPILP